MINIAIVEDDNDVVAQLKEYIARYMGENDMDYHVETFGSAESFLFGGADSFDIILMDIQLPEMDGMSAVKELRKTNELVVVVFVTSLAQYALKGYEVGATDFMVKPLNYYGFALKFRRAVTAAGRNRDENLVVRNKTRVNVLRICDIYYIEIASHTINYHTRGKWVGMVQFRLFGLVIPIFLIRRPGSFWAKNLRCRVLAGRNLCTI